MYSEEDRKKYQEQTAALETNIVAMAEGWKENTADILDFIQFHSRFYSYSLRNVLLICAQNRGAAFVGSYRFFEGQGWYVRKGEHGMKILCPRVTTFYRERPDAAWKLLYSAAPEQKRMAAAGALETREQVKYGLGTVFDISQTDCPLSEYPKYIGLGYPSGQHAEMYRIVTEYCQSIGIPVSEEDFHSVTVRGSYDPETKSIRINRMLGDTQKLSTVLHEMSHGLMNHGTDAKSAAQAEFEADALSVMLNTAFGAEVPDTRRRHLAANFKQLCDEITGTGKIPDPLALLAPVSDLYRGHAEALKAMADRITVSVPAPAAETHFFYDRDAVLAIPMESVCEMLHIPVQKIGSRMTFAVRDEKTPSCVLYADNHFYDFGASRGGDVIHLVQYATGRSWYDSMEMLARTFGIQPSVKKKEGNSYLSDEQYARIGIQADRATRNFDLDVMKYGPDRTGVFVSQYQMPVTELAKQDPGIYHNMLRKRAIPYVYAQRQQYYGNLCQQDALCREFGIDILQAPRHMEPLKAQCRSLRAAEQTLLQAIRDPVLLTYRPKTYDVEKDIAGIRTGRITFEVGPVPYAEIKQKTPPENLSYMTVPAREYDEAPQMQEIPHAAFYKNGEVSLAYDSRLHERLFPGRERNQAYRPASRDKTKPETQTEDDPKLSRAQRG